MGITNPYPDIESKFGRINGYISFDGCQGPNLKSLGGQNVTSNAMPIVSSGLSFSKSAGGGATGSIDSSVKPGSFMHFVVVVPSGTTIADVNSIGTLAYEDVQAVGAGSSSTESSLATVNSFKSGPKTQVVALSYGQVTEEKGTGLSYQPVDITFVLDPLTALTVNKQTASLSGWGIPAS
ncbi:MAG: hypothetical protein A3J38_09415 [Gammaproteobacteria bacterium RIFCSPHIGHO2_12_FULL_45_9]|nr:MAG: hypothetical protein A3J38_09415 [Gammaproteobacteria bacterium RIFCSPHIGHO2_12_FULL_45_9]